MAKKNKGNRNKGDVAEFLLEQRRERNRTEQLAAETVGKGIAYLVDTLVVPLLPSISHAMQTAADTEKMRAETQRLEVEQRLDEARKSLKDHRRALKAQRREARLQSERLDEQLRAVPGTGKGRN